MALRRPLKKPNLSHSSLLLETPLHELLKIQDYIVQVKHKKEKSKKISSRIPNEDYSSKKTLIKSNSNDEKSFKSILDHEFPDLEEVVLNLQKKGDFTAFKGSNLHCVLYECGRKFSLKTVLLIAIQSIEQLEQFHKKGLLHKDIQPENFVVEFDSANKSKVSLIKSIYSTPFVTKTGHHIHFHQEAINLGDPCFMSIYGHLNIQPSRRDDLISLGFMLVYLYFGKLPWSDFDGYYEEGVQAIYDIKLKKSNKELCKGLPKEFVDYFDYVGEIDFATKPDYEFLVGLFRGALIREGFKEDGNYDWMTEKDEKEIDFSLIRKTLFPFHNYKKEI